MTRDLLDEIIHTAVLAADMEALSPRPSSPPRNPDGSMRGETQAEYTRRIVTTAIRHAIDNGLLQVAPDAEQRFELGIPIRYRP